MELSLSLILTLSCLALINQGPHVTDGLRVIADSEKSAIINEDTSLYCSYREEPEGEGFYVVLDWTKSDPQEANGWRSIATGVKGEPMRQPFTSDEAKYEADEQTLHIFHVNEGDSGTYQCLVTAYVTNIEPESGTASIELKVQNRSDSTTPPTVKDNFAAPFTSNVYTVFVLLLCTALVLLS